MSSCVRLRIHRITGESRFFCKLPCLVLSTRVELVTGGVYALNIIPIFTY